MKRFTYFGLVVSMCAMLVGCATISFSLRQNVHLTSTPSKAEYRILKFGDDGSKQVLGSGITPGTISIKRGEAYFNSFNYHIEIALEGYHPVDIPLHSNFAVGAMVFDFLLGVIPLLIIDPLTGSFYYYTANSTTNAEAVVNAELVNRRNLNIEVVFQPVANADEEGFIRIAQAEKR